MAKMGQTHSKLYIVIIYEYKYKSQKKYSNIK